MISEQLILKMINEYSIHEITMNLHTGINPINGFIAKKLSGIVGEYGFHLPNIDEYETFYIHHINGEFIMAFNKELKVISHVFDLEDEQTKKIYHDILKKVSELIKG